MFILKLEVSDFRKQARVCKRIAGVDVLVVSRWNGRVGGLHRAERLAESGA